MTKELVISSNRHETKLAIVEDDQLVEVYFQRSNEYSLVGSIHKGKVTRVLPGMQSAFVELGLERDAFLYVSDFFEESGEEYDRVSADDRGGRKGRLDRQDRPESLEARKPVEPLPAPPEVAPPPAPVPAPAEGGPSPATEAGRDRDGRDKDRRGRRRRRRRGGRGFPDSKYAAPEAGNSENEPEEAGPDAASETEEEFEPIVLPGESIAKYAPAEEGEETDSAPESAEREVVEAAEPRVAAPAEEIAPDPLDVALEITRDEVADAAQEAAEAALAAESVPQIVVPEPAAESEEANPVEAAGAGTELAPEEEEAEDSAEQEESENEPETGAAPESADAPADGDSQAAAGPYNNGQPVARYLQPRGKRPRRRGRDRDRGEVRAERPVPPSGARPPERERDKDRERSVMPSITDLLKEGQEIIVQIAKEPLGTKGARITSHIAMPGRYVVYMPTLDHLGVSRKIPSDDERYRLKKIVQAQSQGLAGGFIVRTAGEGRSESEIGADMRFLAEQWIDIRKRAEKRGAPVLLHHDLELVMRTLRDQVGEQYKAIWIDNEEIYEKAVGFLERFQPGLVNRVKLYTRDTPIFDFFNITSELEKALRPKVWLKSGGYIVINQTEALVAIDINTGKYVGKSNRLEDTIVKTNIEAIKEIVRQVRLRDLGGIIVVDFIDMEERKNRQKVMQALEETMRVDRAPYKILQFNDFGLVAITRRRVKQSLEKALCTPCPTCEGSGYVKAVQTVVGEILTEAHKISKALEGRDVLLRVNPDVAKQLKADGANYIGELEDILGRTVLIKSDPLLHPDKFDLG
jgi:ribonuclease G